MKKIKKSQGENTTQNQSKQDFWADHVKKTLIKTKAQYNIKLKQEALIEAIRGINEFNIERGYSIDGNLLGITNESILDKMWELVIKSERAPN